MKPEFPIRLTRFHRTLLPAFCVTVLYALVTTSARGGSISEKPLFLSVSVPPNVIMGVDDSTSMQAEELMSYGGDYYDSSNGNIISASLAYLFPDGNHVQKTSGTSTNIPPLPQYADARSPVTNRAYFDPTATYTHWSPYGASTFGDAPPTAAPWDAINSNPAVAPPASLCEGGVLPVANFPEVFDLTHDIACADELKIPAKKSTGYSFHVGTKMLVPSGTTYWDDIGQAWVVAKTDLVLNSDEHPNVGVKYFPASFYLPKGFPNPYGDKYTAKPLPDAITLKMYTADDIKDFAIPSGSNWDSTKWDGKTWEGYEIKPENFGSLVDYETAIQNFANWFTYYRKRDSATRGAIGMAFKDISNMSFALFKASDADADSPPNLTMTDLSNASDAAALFNSIYKMTFIKKTSTLQAAQFMGQQFMRPDVIKHACQSNNGILFTDGVPDHFTFVNVGNVDGSYGPPYADSLESTMADVAMKYYVTNLNPSLPMGQVPTPAACDSPNHDPWLDCQKNLHMNFYGVSLGLKGKQFNPFTSTTRSAYDDAHKPIWATEYPGDTLDLEDDLWHATINGRGELLSANRPEQVRDKLIDILDTIVSKISSGAALATSSAFLDTDTLVFQSVFDPSNWSGDLIAYRFLNGKLDSAPVWKASKELPGKRNIYSSVPAGSNCSPISVPSGSVSAGIVFDWANLNCDQQGLLNTTLEGQPDTLGEARLNYIKGDVSKEQRNGGGFRNRVDALGNENLLGDFVHSTPGYTSASLDEDFGYGLLPEQTERESYKTFLLTKSTRTPMIYVGGNDGMLHAFNATKDAPPGGKEVFGYVPIGVYERLSRLTSPGYNQDTHRFLVDGAPWIGDAYLNNKWGTYLVGTTGAGGRSIFALDITHPDPEAADSKFDTAKILWDLSGIGDGDGASLPNLGYTLARPMIVRTNSSDPKWSWVVIMGNGYNSPNGHAVLFIISLADGSFKELDTKAGGNALNQGLVAKNGLSTAITVDRDQNRTVDLVYAGDLLGNVWKFDLTDSDHSKWKIAYGPANSPEPLFIACAERVPECGEADRQPITAKPQVAPVNDSRGGLMVFIGTGKYFEVGDNQVVTDASKKLPQIESFYGLWDRNTLTDATDIVKNNDLVAQTIDAEATVAGGQTVRVTSANTVDYAKKSGWYLDLKLSGGPALGERVATDPLYHEGKITFASFTPTSGTCTTGGTGWLMELDANMGSRPQNTAPIFNVSGPNNTGVDSGFDANDLVTVDGKPTAPSGLASQGIPTTPRLIEAPVGGGGSSPTTPGQMCTSNSTGGVACLDTQCSGPSCPRGRQSWQQLK